MPRVSKKTAQPKADEVANDEPRVSDCSDDEPEQKVATKEKAADRRKNQKKTVQKKSDEEHSSEEETENKNNSGEDEVTPAPKTTWGKKGPKSDADCDQVPEKKTTGKVEDNPRAKTIRVSRSASRQSEPVADTQTPNKGKTYRRDAIDNAQSHDGPVLRFDFQQCIDDCSNMLVKDCSPELLLKYLVSVTHMGGPGKKALCCVFKNTLTGMVGETNLPLPTTGSSMNRSRSAHAFRSDNRDLGNNEGYGQGYGRGRGHAGRGRGGEQFRTPRGPYM